MAQNYKWTDLWMTDWNLLWLHVDLFKESAIYVIKNVVGYNS